MKRILVASAIVALATVAFVAGAQAQSVVPPGQDFYATPVNKGPMMTMPQAKIAQAPAAKPAKTKMMHKMKKKRM